MIITLTFPLVTVPVVKLVLSITMPMMRCDRELSVFISENTNGVHSEQCMYSSVQWKKFGKLDKFICNSPNFIIITFWLDLSIHQTFLLYIYIQYSSVCMVDLLVEAVCLFCDPNSK